LSIFVIYSIGVVDMSGSALQMNSEPSPIKEKSRTNALQQVIGVQHARRDTYVPPTLSQSDVEWPRIPYHVRTHPPTVVDSVKKPV
jgi:hypothetical protein